jgi:hypothetical protein|tara:strand:+ start:10 stop:747 length:738 start_codon:yes stop_codon:yes gene_type:complete
MIKKNERYTYVDATRSEDHGSRTYDVNGNRLPSVTTILGKTKDQSFIRKWKAKVGEVEAERIKNQSSNRGTSMHKYLENYILQQGYEDMTTMGQLAKTMAQKVIDVGLAPVDEWYGSEVTLYYPGLYAGSTDLVCKHNGADAIVDFKQSNRPKRDEWIEDYKMQIAAYAMAHDYVHKSKIEKGVIMVCTPDLYYQEFIIQGLELRKWKHEFLKRLDMFHEIKREKSSDINTTQLLKEFEKDGNKA